jgi:hypothetical protein
MSIELVKTVLDPLHFSRLKLIARSAAHYRGATVEETYAMERGTAVHRMLLTKDRVIGYPGPQRRGKEWDAFEDANSDAVILTAKEFDKAAAMVESVRRCPEAMRLLQGDQERTIGWAFGDRCCEGTPDTVGNGFVTELKATRCSEPGKFAWQARSMAYHAQLAWYMDGCQAGKIATPEQAYCVAVESTAPFPVTVFQLTPRMLDEGRRLYRLWFERLMTYEAVNEWPAYAQGVVALDVPEDEPELDWSGVEDAA